MASRKITENISFLEASESPLSADVGIIRENGAVWLFDVGNGADHLPDPSQKYHVVLSHFHADHIGNLDLVPTEALFVSRETFRHTHRGTVVDQSVSIGRLRLFPLPSSHAKGCLGLEVDGLYAFVGDALGGRSKNGSYTYNAQLLQEEIGVLKSLTAPYLLVSHHTGLVRDRLEAIAELEAIYKTRKPGETEIIVF